MKRLLFLLACALLLILAIAGPALAADQIQWQVWINIHAAEAPPAVLWSNYTTMYWSDIDAKGRPYAAVPRTATDVAVGSGAAFVNSGNTAAFAKAFFQRIDVYDPSGKQIVHVDETDCQNYWSDLYRFNDWGNPYDPLLPYNPNIGQGMMWGVDWYVPLLRAPSTATSLKAGIYTVVYNNMLTHTLADPMFPGRVPGGEGYPPIGHAAPWNDEPIVVTFRVR